MKGQRDGAEMEHDGREEINRGHGAEHSHVITLQCRDPASRERMEGLIIEL